MAKAPPGVYVPLNVNYVRDPKVRRAGPDAELLYVRGLAHAKGAETDGVIFDFDLEVVAVGLPRVNARVKALVEVGLWEEVDGGWRVVGWEKWNPLVADLRALKARQRESAIATNHQRYHVDKGEFSRSCPLCLERGATS